MKKKNIYNCMQRSFQNRISFHLLAPKSHGYSKSVIRGVKKWTIIVIMKISIFSIWALDFFMWTKQKLPFVQTYDICSYALM